MKAVEVLPGRTINEPPYLIMEWIPRDLRSFLLKDNEKQVVLEQVSNGLSFMYDNAFAHRDLKPENILIDEYEGGLVAKIADVGMSKLDRVENMQPTQVHLSTWRRSFGRKGTGVTQEPWIYGRSGDGT